MKIINKKILNSKFEQFSKNLQDRTKKFTLLVIELVEKIDYSISKKVVSTQLVKAAKSVGANYRAACRARSDKEFISKLNIVLEETDKRM